MYKIDVVDLHEYLFSDLATRVGFHKVKSFQRTLIERKTQFY
jgi:hypothetical protein